MAQRVAAWFWFVAARLEWWLWLSALVLASCCALWFVARGRRRARMCSPEVRGSRFVLEAGDSLMSRCSEKVKIREQLRGPARRCKPTSRRRGRSWMDGFEAGDKRKLHFYS